MRTHNLGYRGWTSCKAHPKFNSLQDLTPFLIKHGYLLDDPIFKSDILKTWLHEHGGRDMPTARRRISHVSFSRASSMTTTPNLSRRVSISSNEDFDEDTSEQYATELCLEDVAHESYVAYMATGLENKTLASSTGAIFNKGPILPVIHGLRMFADSKTFVDMQLTKHPDDVLTAYLELAASTNMLTPDDMEQFIRDNFKDCENEMVLHIPEDWNHFPDILNTIGSERGLLFAEHIVHQWRNLCRKVKPEIADFPERFTLMDVKHPFIIPGGRFREFYYWDSFWINRGLLICDMVQSAKDIINNYIHLIKNYGFIPNGGRIYYLTRSQPPLLTLMVDDYFQRTRDMKWLRKYALPALEQEYLFWMKHRRCIVLYDGEKHYFNRYNAAVVNEPRPESYREDVETTSGATREEAAQIYCEVASACESGWDFSSRWAGDPPTWDGNLATLTTSSIIPVDLNAFMFKIEIILSKYYAFVGKLDKSLSMLKAASKRQESMNKVMWNEKHGCWFDFDIRLGCQREFYFPSNVFPLWVNLHQDIFTKEFDVSYEKAVVKYLRANGVCSSTAVHTSHYEETGQQWDGPIVWPPLNSIVIEMLMNGQTEEARELGRDIIFGFLRIMMHGFDVHKCMLEKYNPRAEGGLAQAGEYTLQIGFGWTNGAALQLLSMIFDSEDSGWLQEHPMFSELFPDMERSIETDQSISQE